ncbi:MAG: ribbon-helix-helix protein, CopG family [Bryobacteraceae bacterium]|jgi:predicted transcriptional regulator
MTTNELKPTTIRLRQDALETLDEAAGLLKTTRADVIRQAINVRLDQWNATERKQAIELLLLNE